MRSLLLSSVLFAFGSAQNPPEQCVYTANDGNFVLNLTEISDWTLEYEDPDHFYYYTPCRNGLRCTQGGALFSANSIQMKQGANVCTHYLSVDHHEQAEYSFIGGSWRFHYEDGEVCDVTQQPRKTTIFYHCNNVNVDGPAHLESAEEREKCDYTFSISSALACMPEERHNANCQWKVPVGDGKYKYLDLSDLKGEVVHGQLGNGYEFYHSICANKIPCYQQHQRQVMSVIDNKATGTCEHSMSVWENGQVQPLLHELKEGTHWTFHYWNGQTCSNGEQGEEKIRFFCDREAIKPQVMGVYGQGDCIFDMNISTRAACDTLEPRWVDAAQWFEG